MADPTITYIRFTETANTFRHEMLTASSSTDKDLAKLLGRTIVELQQLDPDLTFINLSTALSKSEVYEEIDKIANNWCDKDDWCDEEMSFASHDTSAESQIWRVSQVLGIHPGTTPVPGAFERVVTILARAASRTTMKPAYVLRQEIEKQNREIRQKREHIDRYVAYVKAAQKEQRVRAELRDRLHSLPPEMRNFAFGHLARLMLPAKVQIDEEKLMSMAMQVLRSLTEVGGYESPFKHLHMMQTGDEASKTIKELVSDFSNEIQKAIVEFMPISNKAEFPTKALPNRIPIPLYFATENRQNLLQHLHLEAKLRALRGTYYPATLYGAQDQISNVKQWAPNLKSLRLEILNDFNRDHSNAEPRYVVRLPGTGYTTMEELLERVVKSFKTASVGQKAFRYQEAWWTQLEGWGKDREEGGVDGKGMESKDVMQVLTNKKGDWVWL